MNDIAGIRNAAGNVVGLMPHPEHAVEAGFGTRGAHGPRTGTDGLSLLQRPCHLGWLRTYLLLGNAQQPHKIVWCFVD